MFTSSSPVQIKELQCHITLDLEVCFALWERVLLNVFVLNQFLQNSLQGSLMCWIKYKNLLHSYMGKKSDLYLLFMLLYSNMELPSMIKQKSQKVFPTIYHQLYKLQSISSHYIFLLNISISDFNSPIIHHFILYLSR